MLENIAILIVPAALQIAAILLISLVLLAILKHGLKTLTAKLSENHAALFETFASILRLSILTIGIIMSLSTVGIDVSALVAGLGLSGFALSFAFKDILSNVLSGVLLIFYSPFKAGQHIKVDSFEGKVIGMDLRYVTLVNNGEKSILVPNSMALTKVVIVSPKDAPSPKYTANAEQAQREQPDKDPAELLALRKSPPAITNGSFQRSSHDEQLQVHPASTPHRKHQSTYC